MWPVRGQRLSPQIRRRLLALFFLVCLPATGLANDSAGLRFLPPGDCLPSDGGPPVDLHAIFWGREIPTKSVHFESNFGRIDEVKALGQGLYRMRFWPPSDSKASEIKLKAKLEGDQAYLPSESFPLCRHPAGRIALKVRPAQLIAGLGQSSLLDLMVFDHADKPVSGLPLQVSCNVGRLDPLQEMGQGRYQIRYHPPGDPFPQVAIILVSSPKLSRMDRIAVARAVIPITARIELPGRTEPGTRMSMSIAGKRYGPVRADNLGKFTLPILVPPGYGRAKATSVDRAGNKKTRSVDLFLPETNQLGLWAWPSSLQADGLARSRILITSIDRFGMLKDRTHLRAKARRGTIGKLRRLDRGLFEAYYQAPASLGDGKDRIDLFLSGKKDKNLASLELCLLEGPAHGLELQVPEVLEADGRSQAQLRLRVLDDSGQVLRGHLVRWQSNVGNVTEGSQDDQGWHKSTLKVEQNPKTWTAEIRAEVRDRPGSVPTRILIGPQALQKVNTRDWVLEGVVVDEGGLPVSGIKLSLHCGEQMKHSKPTDAFGRTRIPLLTLPGSVPSICFLRQVEGSLEKTLAWIWRENRPVLLPLDLDDALPPGQALVAQAEVPLHPAAPVKLSLHLEAGPEPGVHRIRIKVTGTDPKLKASASCGQLGPLKPLSSGQYELHYSAPDAQCKKALVTVVEQNHHVASAIRIDLTKEARKP